MVATPDRPHALVLAPFSGEGLDLLANLCDITHEPWIDASPIRMYSAADLAARVADVGASILICESDEVSGPVFDQPLRAIGITRGDPNNVDLPGATKAGIPVVNAPGRNADAVAELTLGLLLDVTRKISYADREVRIGQMYRDGTIPYQRFRAWQLGGRTVGLVGLGAVGRATKWRLEALGARVIAFDPYAADATHSLPDLLATSDVVSMHAPVTEETRGMIGREQFAAMKRGAVYLNTARAALHDTPALIEALQSGQVSAAGLDHFEGEWIDADHPLAALDNVVLTPHIGGATYDTEANHSLMIASDVQRLLAGEPPVYCVNPEVLDQ